MVIIQYTWVFMNDEVKRIMSRAIHAVAPVCLLALTAMSNLGAQTVPRARPFRDIPASELKVLSLERAPTPLLSAVEPVPRELRSPDGRMVAQILPMSSGLESRTERIVIAGPSPSRRTVADVVN